MNDSLAAPITRAGELQLLSRDRTRRVAGFSFTHLTIMRTSGPAQAQTGEQVVEVECAISGLSFNPGELLT